MRKLLLLRCTSCAIDQQLFPLVARNPLNLFTRFYQKKGGCLKDKEKKKKEGMTIIDVCSDASSTSRGSTAGPRTDCSSGDPAGGHTISSRGATNPPQDSDTLGFFKAQLLLLADTSAARSSGSMVLLAPRTVKETVVPLVVVGGVGWGGGASAGEPLLQSFSMEGGVCVSPGCTPLGSNVRRERLTAPRAHTQYVPFQGPIMTI